VNGGPQLFPIRQVKTVGLPLLMEFSCFPSDSGLGINALDVSVDPLVTLVPCFRAYSAGGFNTFGNASPVLPDSELIPKGGFNPFSTPPGLATIPVDSIYYVGQLDTVVRLSRVHSVWLDSGGNTTTWQTPVPEPPASAQPSGTAVLLDFRGTGSFTGAAASSSPFDATALNMYGDPLSTTSPDFSPSPAAPTWSSNIADANGDRYLQVRLTFVNNTSTGLSPDLTALAIPFTR
jgi:hypothetical protein